jgi:hypothetical protein
MHIQRLSFALVPIIGLAGCADLYQAGYGVSAEPLFDLSAAGQINSVPILPQGGDAKTEAWKYVNLSEAKCTKFVNGLIASEAGSNTGLDIVSTVASSLATAFTAQGTTHALSAAAAIASGSKTAVDSDVFAKASIANFAQAISSTYFKDIGNYGTQLGAATTVDFNAEIAKIQTIHAECALGPAQATISSTLQGSNTTTPPPPPAPGAPAAVGAAAPAAGASSTGFVVPGHPVQSGISN